MRSRAAEAELQNHDPAGVGGVDGDTYSPFDLFRNIPKCQSRDCAEMRSKDVDLFYAQSEKL